MIDARSALRTNRAHWLRVRANVRGLATALVAAEYALRRDARRNDDPDMATLVLQLALERQAIETLGFELDARIAAVSRDCAAIEAQTVASIVAAAHARSARRT